MWSFCADQNVVTVVHLAAWLYVTKWQRVDFFLKLSEETTSTTLSSNSFPRIRGLIKAIIWGRKSKPNFALLQLPCKIVRGIRKMSESTFQVQPRRNLGYTFGAGSLCGLEDSTQFRAKISCREIVNEFSQRWGTELCHIFGRT